MTLPLNVPKATPLLCLDIDGTVRQGKDDALGRFVNGPEDVFVFPEAVEMMRRWKAGGGRICGISNQGGIALGLVTIDQVTGAMWKTHYECDELFDKLSWCSHHPDAEDITLTSCWCRKPLPGLIIEAAHDLGDFFGEHYPQYMGLMVGDRPEDQECARLAGLEFQWAADWRAQAGLVNS